jgi:hypothetical protein
MSVHLMLQSGLDCLAESAHLASIGHALVGDSLYGATGQPLENLPGCN